MQSGLRVGLRSGLLSGLNARFVPSTADEFAAALPAVTAPDGLWIFDEASGDFLDRIGSNDFSVAAGTVTRGVATPFGQGIELATSNAKLTVSDTSFMDAGTDTDLSWLLVCQPAQVAASRTLIHKRVAGGTNDGWHTFKLSSGAIEIDVDGANGTIQNTAVSGEHGGKWTPVIGVIDWSRIRLNTLLGSNESAVLTVDDLTSTSPLTIGQWASQSAAGLVVVFAAAWDGYALDATERKILRDFFA
jgi:hypothetical protein